jgi:ubiquitin C-terminal hydrolase
MYVILFNPKFLFYDILASANKIIPSTKNHIHNRIKSQTMIANFPDVLCIQLKRFSYDRLSNTATKLNTPIIIEPEKILDLSHLHYTTWLGLTNLSTTYNYRLIAVCLHLSEKASPILSSKNVTQIIHGHCVCLYRTDHNRWFLCDDERITEINETNNFFQTSYVTENCYLVFYERCS